jgi:hypothetical protein
MNALQADKNADFVEFHSSSMPWPSPSHGEGLLNVVFVCKQQPGLWILSILSGVADY